VPETPIHPGMTYHEWCQVADLEEIVKLDDAFLETHGRDLMDELHGCGVIGRSKCAWRATRRRRRKFFRDWKAKFAEHFNEHLETKLLQRVIG
jgi:hypothetical protein